jgi:signal transduction histidine kinase
MNNWMGLNLENREANAFRSSTGYHGVERAKLFLKTFYRFLTVRDNIELANDFPSYHVRQSLTSIRFSFLLGVILFAAFGILDLYMAPDSKGEIFFVRFYIVIPLLLSAFIVSYTQLFFSKSQVFQTVIASVIGLALIWIIACTKPHEPAHSLYASGLILCLIWTHTVLRLTPARASVTSCVLIGIYNVVAIISSEPVANESLQLISNNFFLLGTVVLGSWSSNATYRMFQKDYQQTLTIKNEKESLALSAIELQKSNGFKSKLISIMSHDIRSPIAGIKGLLSLLQSNGLSPGEFKEFTKSLGSSVDRTMDLLDNLLSWSVLQLKEHELKLQPVALSAVIEKVFLLVARQANEKNTNLINNIASDVTVLAEPVMIELVIRNLVTNAIKFTERGQITASVSVSATAVEIKIEDTGCGMPPDIAERLLNPKHRISQNGTRAERGAGIGLMLCKEFIEKLDGTITFSTQLNLGTTFFLSIPNKGK